MVDAQSYTSWSAITGIINGTHNSTVKSSLSTTAKRTNVKRPYYMGHTWVPISLVSRRSWIIARTYWGIGMKILGDAPNGTYTLMWSRTTPRESTLSLENNYPWMPPKHTHRPIITKPIPKTSSCSSPLRTAPLGTTSLENSTMSSDIPNSHLPAAEHIDHSRSVPYQRRDY